jgi:hypothetical protein
LEIRRVLTDETFFEIEAAKVLVTIGDECNVLAAPVHAELRELPASFGLRSGLLSTETIFEIETGKIWRI